MIGLRTVAAKDLLSEPFSPRAAFSFIGVLNDALIGVLSNGFDFSLNGDA